MATFIVNHIFGITNRGLVLAGDIIDGIINSGDSIQLELNGLPIQLKIKSVEYVDHVRDMLQSAAGKIISISCG